jgi:hypothetical protein
MLAYRWTWIIKQGRMEECLELNTTTPELRSKEYAKIRFYTPSIGPNVFVVEMVVENEEAMGKWFAEFNATPGADAFWEKMHALAERMIGGERWNVTELGD